jgi:hypothetical protein
VIKTFKCKETEGFITVGSPGAYRGTDSQRAAARKLEMLSAAARLESLNMSPRDFEPVHPGEISWKNSLSRLAKDISVPQRRISEIVQGKRSSRPIRTSG